MTKPLPTTDPRVHSLDLADRDAVASFLDEHATPNHLETFINRLRGVSVCRWCLAPLRHTPDCPDTVADAGEAEWCPTTVIRGIRRGERSVLYCDREDCGKAGLLDDPAPRECRNKPQLHQHLDNFLRALTEYYGIDVDAEAAHDALEAELRDRDNGGRDVGVLATALHAALED